MTTRPSAMDDADGVMAQLSPYIEHTPGPLDVEALEPAELEFFLALPDTLQELLRRWNGAFFNGEAGFGTGVEVRREGAASRVDDDSLVELWGLTRTLSRSESDEIPHDLVAEAARHDDEAFLPRGLVAIGYGMQHSLVLVSVRPEDRGAVYYWDWYWQYPWKIDFFMGRIKRATAPSSPTWPERPTIRTTPTTTPSSKRPTGPRSSDCTTTSAPGCSPCSHSPTQTSDRPVHDALGNPSAQVDCRTRRPPAAVAGMHERPGASGLAPACGRSGYDPRRRPRPDRRDHATRGRSRPGITDRVRVR